MNTYKKDTQTFRFKLTYPEYLGVEKAVENFIETAKYNKGNVFLYADNRRIGYISDFNIGKDTEQTVLCTVFDSAWCEVLTILDKAAYVEPLCDIDTNAEIVKYVCAFSLHFLPSHKKDEAPFDMLIVGGNKND
jgi:hypothetical protein